MNFLLLMWIVSVRNFNAHLNKELIMKKFIMILLISILSLQSGCYELPKYVQNVKSIEPTFKVKIDLSENEYTIITAKGSAVLGKYKNNYYIITAYHVIDAGKIVDFYSSEDEYLCSIENKKFNHIKNYDIATYKLPYDFYKRYFNDAKFYNIIPQDIFNNVYKIDAYEDGEYRKLEKKIIINNEIEFIGNVEFGMSGGALLNMDNELIGIISMKKMDVITGKSIGGVAERIPLGLLK